MIDLSVMHLLAAAIFALIGLSSKGLSFQNSEISLTVTNLESGAVLQGTYPIQGTVGAENFSGYEVSFGYNDDQTDTWFLIFQGEEPVQDGVLTSWDTTQITDGNYRLRVLVKLNDGSTQQLVVNDLKVRNYTSPEPTLITSGAAAVSATKMVNTSSPTPNRIAVTSTPFSVNPGSLSQADFQVALTRGAGISGGIFVLLGLYFAFRKRPHRR